MTEERLAGLTMMAGHYRQAAKLDTVEIVKHFDGGKDSRTLAAL